MHARALYTMLLVVPRTLLLSLTLVGRLWREHHCDWLLTPTAKAKVRVVWTVKPRPKLLERKVEKWFALVSHGSRCCSEISERRKCSCLC